MTSPYNKITAGTAGALTIKGAGQYIGAGTPVTISIYGSFNGGTATLLGTATTIPGNTWSFTTSALANGDWAFTAVASATGYTTSSVSTAYDVVVDYNNAIPGTVELTNDTGVSSIDGITSDADLNGTGVAGATITLVGTGVNVSTVVNASGNWSYHLTGLEQGTINLNVDETDLAGNVNDGVESFVYDTVADVSMGLANDTSFGSLVTSDPTLAGATSNGTYGAGATITITEGSTVLGTTTADVNGNWTFTPTGLSDGLQTVTANEVDVAGNTASTTLSFTLDTIAHVQYVGLTDDTSRGDYGAGTTDTISSDGSIDGTVTGT